MKRDSSLPNKVIEMMGNHLETASIEMFADFEIAIDRRHSAPPVTSIRGNDPTVMSVIGYVGPGIRGALIMVAAEVTIAAWLTRMGSEGADPGDALGEFSNMLLGRLKTRLLPEGLTLQLATPTIASGNCIRLSLPPNQSASLVFNDPAGVLRLRVDANFDPDFALAETSDRDVPPARAGEAIFF